MTKIKKVQTFISIYLRLILNINWPDMISNGDLLTRTQQLPATDETERGWTWIRRTLRKTASNQTHHQTRFNMERQRLFLKGFWHRLAKLRTHLISPAKLYTTIISAFHVWLKCPYSKHLLTDSTAGQSCILRSVKLVAT